MKLGLGLGVGFGSGRRSAVWTPAQLFAAGEAGAWYDPSDSSTVFQDAAATTPAGVGDPVGYMADKSGNGNHATQSTTARKPILRQSGGLYYLEFDGFDDYLKASFTIGQPTTLGCGFYATANDNFISDGFGNNSGSLYILSPSNSLRLYAGVSLTSAAPVTLSQPAVAAGVINSVSSVLRLNGDESTGDAGTNSMNGITLGANGGGSSILAGRIYGFVSRGGVSTASELVSMESFLATKSGVSL